MPDISVCRCFLENSASNWHLNSDSVIQAHIVIIGLKRKISCSRSSKAENACDLLYNFDQSLPTSNTNVAVKHLQPVGVGEENERRGRKRRMESPSRYFSDPRADSGQKVKVEDQWQRSTEDQDSLQHTSCSVEKHGVQEPRSSGPDVLSPEDQQVQPPPAQVPNSN
ncbi:hypothetical protein DPX16_9322 [Anabarilius grahami]|uniref:Uncharacterized protein n=1 Tax=Anabarilius grahami TaxID=495550 RepID=A0A3N0Y6J1_ANAGA|nr:hypothetical protein DPX16_9322 [Anabarilius grahami]